MIGGIGESYRRFFECVVRKKRTTPLRMRSFASGKMENLQGRCEAELPTHDAMKLRHEWGTRFLCDGEMRLSERMPCFKA